MYKFVKDTFHKLKFNHNILKTKNLVQIYIVDRYRKNNSSDYAFRSNVNWLWFIKDYLICRVMSLSHVKNIYFVKHAQVRKNKRKTISNEQYNKLHFFWIFSWSKDFERSRVFKILLILHVSSASFEFMNINAASWNRVFKVLSLPKLQNISCLSNGII